MKYAQLEQVNHEIYHENKLLRDKNRFLTKINNEFDKENDEL